MEIVNIPVGKIRPDPNQPRKSFDRKAIQEMALNIKHEGVINPIEIDSDYMIVTGETRWRAAKIAGMKRVPCKVIEINPEERYLRQVSENVHHNTMSAWDTSVAIKRLIDELSNDRQPHNNADKGIRELSRRLGKSPQWISNMLEIQREPEDIQEAIRTNKIPPSYVTNIGNIPEEFRDRVRKKVLEGSIVGRDIINVLGTALRNDPSKADELLSLDLSKGNDVTKANVVINITKTPAQQIEEQMGKADKITNATVHLTKLLKEIPFTDLSPIDQVLVSGRLVTLASLFDEYLAQLKELQNGIEEGTVRNKLN